MYGILYNMKYKKSGFTPEYRKILIYSEQGMPVKEIAEKVNMHPTYVYEVMKKDIFLEKKKEFETKIVDKARAVFEAHAVKAAEKIVKIAKGGKAEDRIKLDASKEVLYQVGMKPVEVIETRKREYTPEELASMFKTVVEVEEISDRLSSRNSKFVLTNTDAEPKTEQTSGPGQKTVPAEPVLPV